MNGSDFWSRRKAAVAAEQEADRAPDEKIEDAFEGQTDSEILETLGLPDPETLGEGDDFSVFLNAAVPDRLRRIALRKLWTTNPTLANLDGLVDYGEDFTDAATVMENLSTAYQVGKGMTAHVEKLLRGEASPETDDVMSEDAKEAELSAQPSHPEVPSESTDEEGENIVEDINHEHDHRNVYARPRRMRYSFQDDQGDTA